MRYVEFSRSTKVKGFDEDDRFEEGKVSFKINAPQLEVETPWEDFVGLCGNEGDAVKFLNKVLAARSTSQGAAQIKSLEYVEGDALNAPLATAQEEAYAASKKFEVRTGTSAAAIKSNVMDLETMAKNDPEAFAELSPAEILAMIQNG